MFHRELLALMTVWVQNFNKTLEYLTLRARSGQSIEDLAKLLQKTYNLDAPDEAARDLEHEAMMLELPDVAKGFRDLWKEEADGR